MANFQIDKLDLTYDKAANNYSLTGICNKADINAPQNITSTFVDGDGEVAFDSHGIDPNKNIAISCNPFNFSGCNAATMLNIHFRDFQDLAASDKRKGGINIKDTNYPPPRTVMPFKGEIFVSHTSFSNQFYIESLVLCRSKTSTNFFDITIKVRYTVNDTTYTVNSMVFALDASRNNKKVLLLNVNITAHDGSSHTDELLTFKTATGTPIDLSDPIGLSILIKDINANLDANITSKKGLIYMI